MHVLAAWDLAVCYVALVTSGETLKGEFLMKTGVGELPGRSINHDFIKLRYGE